MLPNLFVIGAAKSGTSSLHHYLSLHPEIHMSAEKEPHYFSQLVGMVNSRLPSYDEKGYRALFASTLPVRGESSVTYAFWPYPAGVPEAIRAVVPEARFVYLVRDPVDRYLAHYNHRVALGTERRSLDEVVVSPDEASERYLAASSYATQLEQYWKQFAEERVLVLDHADLLHRRREALRQVFTFLGVDADFDDVRFAERVNRSEEDRHFSELGRRVRTSRSYRRVSRRMGTRTRARLMKPVRNVLSRPVPRVTLTGAQREVVASVLRPEAERLRSMTGGAFGSWQV